MADIDVKAGSGDPKIDGILYGLEHLGSTVAVLWDESLLTFSFPALGSYYGAGYGDGENGANFEAFVRAQKVAVRAILDHIADFTALDFSEVTESATTHATLRFAESILTNEADEAAPAYAYLPSDEALYPWAGDAWFNSEFTEFNDPPLGTYAWFTFIHEIGHTLSLTHGHEDENSMGGFGALPTQFDSLEFSTMTYRSYVGAPLNGYTNGFSSYPQTYMMLDMAALQYLYGANFNHNAGNSVYTFSPTTGEMFINGVGRGAPFANKIFLTIWDGGGEDTYDFSNYSDGVTIDLTPGGWSAIEDESQIDPNSSQRATLGFPGGSVVFARANVFNALQYQGDSRSLIENATGGSGDDVIMGNLGNNRLIGGDGNDHLQGLQGNDVLDGGPGVDTLIGGGGFDFIDGGDGADVLLGYTKRDFIDGGEGDDFIGGGKGHDVIDGGAGDDVIIAHGGRDVVHGGAGSDDMRGYGGDDVFFGDEGADVLVGAGGDDELSGGSGSDVLRGRVGDDVLVGGLDADELSGEGGADAFVFETIADSGTSDGLRDVITDFSRAEGDVIDLSAIDAVAGGGDDAFTVVGGFTNTAGELTLTDIGGGTIRVALDVDGDGAADMEFDVQGQADLGAGDFVL